MPSHGHPPVHIGRGGAEVLQFERAGILVRVGIELGVELAVELGRGPSVVVAAVGTSVVGAAVSFAPVQAGASAHMHAPTTIGNANRFPSMWAILATGR